MPDTTCGKVIELQPSWGHVIMMPYIPAKNFVFEPIPVNVAQKQASLLMAESWERTKNDRLANGSSYEFV